MAKNRTSFKRGTTKAKSHGSKGGKSRPSLKKGRKKK